MSRKGKEIIEELLNQVNVSGRAFSDVTLQFHELVAQKAGLSGADHKYLSIIMQYPSLTAGELAKISGLTTGAITGVIDRLESQKLVSREKDAVDRRKVVLVANRKIADKLLRPVFQRLLSRLAKVNKGFSESELKIIIRYMTETNVAMKELIDELK